MVRLDAARFPYQSRVMAGYLPYVLMSVILADKRLLSISSSPSAVANMANTTNCFAFRLQPASSQIHTATPDRYHERARAPTPRVLELTIMAASSLEAREDVLWNFLLLYYWPFQLTQPFGNRVQHDSHFFPEWLLPTVMAFSALGHLANLFMTILHIRAKYFRGNLAVELEGTWWWLLELLLLVVGLLGCVSDALALDYVTRDPVLAQSLTWIRWHLQGVLVACFFDDSRKIITLQRLAEVEEEEGRAKAAAMAVMPAPTKLDMLEAAFEAIAVYFFPIGAAWGIYNQLAQATFEATSEMRFNELAWMFAGCHAVITSGLVLHIRPRFASSKLPARVMRMAAFTVVGALLILAQHASEIVGYYTQDPFAGAAVTYAAAEVYMTILVNMMRDARQLERTEVDGLERRLIDVSVLSKADG